jgi:hypothetical protein
VTEPTRAWIYRVALAVGALLVAYGLISEAEAAQWALLLAALLGLGTDALATRHTSTSDHVDLDDRLGQ